jgi:hypothetical protein
MTVRAISILADRVPISDETTLQVGEMLGGDPGAAEEFKSVRLRPHEDRNGVDQHGDQVGRVVIGVVVHRSPQRSRASDQLSYHTMWPAVPLGLGMGDCNLDNLRGHAGPSGLTTHVSHLPLIGIAARSATRPRPTRHESALRLGDGHAG